MLGTSNITILMSNLNILYRFYPEHILSEIVNETLNLGHSISTNLYSWTNAMFIKKKTSNTELRYFDIWLYLLKPQVNSDFHNFSNKNFTLLKSFFNKTKTENENESTDIYSHIDL